MEKEQYEHHFQGQICQVIIVIIHVTTAHNLLVSMKGF